MADSIQDQLRRLGLAEVGKPRKQRGEARARNATRPRQGDGGQMPLDKAWRLREQEEQNRAAQAKAEKRARDLERRQINARVQAIVEAHGLNEPGAELKRSFTYKGRIRSVLVTAAQLRALNAGALGVVFLRGSYHLLAPEHVAAVRAFAPEHVPDLAGGSDDDGDHPVPDDLVW